VSPFTGHGPHWRSHHAQAGRAPTDEAAARPLAEEKGDNDNIRIKRYVSKYHDQPALAHGMAHSSSLIEPANSPICVVEPSMFGAKPEIGRQGGSSHGADGRSNASIPRRAVFMRPCSVAFGRATGMTPSHLSASFEAKGRRQTYGLTSGWKRSKAAQSRQKDLKWNMRCEDYRDPETYEVAPMRLLTCEPRAFCHWPSAIIILTVPRIPTEWPWRRRKRTGGQNLGRL